MSSSSLSRERDASPSGKVAAWEEGGVIAQFNFALVAPFSQQDAEFSGVPLAD